MTQDLVPHRFPDRTGNPTPTLPKTPELRYPIAMRGHSTSPLVEERPRPLPATLQPLEDLSFPTRVIGHSNARLIPQRVGKWWLEPLQLDPLTLQPIKSSTEIPPRAKQRLQEFLDKGVVPRAVVVFHEIPGEQRALFPIERTAIRLHRFAHQELPVLISQSAALASVIKGQAQTQAPVLGSLALTLMQRSAPLLGVLALASLAVLGHLATVSVAVAATAVALDPCLVAITPDGYWVELDRWI